MAKTPSRGRSIIERPSTAIFFLLVVFAIGIIAGIILAKLRPPLPGPATTQVLIHPSTDPVKFAIGDRVQVYFADLANPGSETTKIYTVDDKGTIPIPRLGALMAKGHTARELEEAMSNAYRERGMYKSMRVEVTRPGPEK